MKSPLYKQLIKSIGEKGHLTIAEYMQQCLYDAEHGFYTNLSGITDHFVTAPEISQLFSEMLAIHLILKWERFGKPEAVTLIELGPGNGTLAHDMTRILSQHLGPYCQLSYILVEQSPALQERQKNRLKDAPCPVQWTNWQQASTLSYASGCTFIIANEFFDALPIHQYEKISNTWFERCVTSDHAGKLFFSYTEELTHATSQFPQNSHFYEYCPQAHEWFDHILSIFKYKPGACVIVDYGFDTPSDGYQDTLQAIYQHLKVPPLSHCGRSDLTAHVDFGALMKQAAHHPFATYLTTQQEFLTQHGIMLRLERLLTQKTIGERTALIQGAHRLTAPDQMGRLFKVLLCATD